MRHIYDKTTGLHLYSFSGNASIPENGVEKTIPENTKPEQFKLVKNKLEKIDD